MLVVPCPLPAMDTLPGKAQHERNKQEKENKNISHLQDSSFSKAKKNKIHQKGRRHERSTEDSSHNSKCSAVIASKPFGFHEGGKNQLYLEWHRSISSQNSDQRNEKENKRKEKKKKSSPPKDSKESLLETLNPIKKSAILICSFVPTLQLLQPEHQKIKPYISHG